MLQKKTVYNLLFEAGVTDTHLLQGGDETIKDLTDFIYTI